MTRRVYTPAVTFPVYAPAVVVIAAICCVVAGLLIAIAGALSGVVPVGSVGGIVFGLGAAGILCTVGRRHE